MNEDIQGHIKVIHKSFLVGQNKDAVNQIDDFIQLYDAREFWLNYSNYLLNDCILDSSPFVHLQRAIIVYSVIKEK